MNTHITTNHTSLDPKEITHAAAPLKEYLEELHKATRHYEYNGKETALNLCNDAAISDETCELAKKLINPHLKYVFVVGIGGSNLGTKAIYEALTGVYDIGTHTYPKIIFIDTVSSLLHMNIEGLVDEHIEDTSDFVINVISKSGTTVEILSNFDVLYKLLQSKCDDVHTRVVITTLKDSPLWEHAQKNGFICVDHRNVSGRFSVFSAVGQLPLRLAGFDVDKLLEGASRMLSACLSKDMNENPALLSATTIYLHKVHGKSTYNNFFFNPELESLGKWYRQLMAESLGKNEEAGMLPIVSVGSTDLHSMIQLYFAGPRTMFTTFTYAIEDDPMLVENASELVDVLPHLKGRKIGAIMETIYHAVTEAYQQKKLPYNELNMSDISEHTLGEYMQLRIVEMMFLAHLLKVNAFDQPHVEDYKKIMKFS